MVQLFLTIFMVVTYALAAAILTYVSICSIEDSKDQQQFETITKSIEEQNENGDTDTTNKVYDLMLKNKDCVGWLKVVDMDVNYPVMLTSKIQSSTCAEILIKNIHIWVLLLWMPTVISASQKISSFMVII